MIDEAVGKILGMAMAYAVSSLGLFLAYASYRRRVVGARRVMSATAWVVLAVVVVGVAAAVWTVAALVEPAAGVAVAEVETEVPAPPTPGPIRGRSDGGFPILGLVLPGLVFLVATGVTFGLYRHFASRLR